MRVDQNDDRSNSMNKVDDNRACSNNSVGSKQYSTCSLSSKRNKTNTYFLFEDVDSIQNFEVYEGTNRPPEQDISRNSKSPSGVYLENSGHLNDSSSIESSVHASVLYHTTTKLNRLNVANLVCYILKIIVILIVLILEKVGHISYDTVWSDYQTLITPAPFTLLIWPLILVCEAAFTFAQLTPSYRSRSLVQEGAGYLFIFSIFGEILWIIFFSIEQFFASLIASGITMASLFILKHHQYHVSNSAARLERSSMDFWLLCFPFTLHAVWAVVAFSVTFNMVISQLGGSSAIQLSLSIITMTVWLLFAFYFVIISSSPHFTFPLVMTWSYIGIGTRLLNPSESLQYVFTSDVTYGLSFTCFSFALLGLIMTLPRVIMHFFNDFFTIDIIES